MVSLPSEWLKRHNLNKGDSIFLQENGNGELLLCPVIKDKVDDLKEIVINAENKDIKALDRELRSAYIKNYHFIKIIDKDLNSRLKDVKSIIYGLSSIEVVEQTPTKIVLKDFLDVRNISINNMVRQMDILIRSMIEDLKLGIKGKKDYESLYERDLDVNKLYFLLWKVIQRAFSDGNFMRSLGTSYSQLVSYLWFVTNLEKIADETKRISKILAEIDLTKKQSSDLSDLFLNVEKDYLDLMKANYNKDYKLAYDVAVSKEINIRKCDDFFEKNKGEPHIAKIVEKMKSFESYISHMGRIITDLF